MKFKDRKYHPSHVWRVARALLHRFWHLSRSDVLAVTGSCGKTSATHFLGRILSDRGPCFVGVHKNARIRVLKNLLKARGRQRFFVQEVGVQQPGEMPQILFLLRPNIGIVTTIGSDHYTSFRTLETTAAEKSLLVSSLPKSGTAVLNADDPHVLGMRHKTAARVLTYGLSEEADVRATDIRSAWPERLSLTVSYRDESVRIETGLFGDLLTASLLAAVTGAIAAGATLQQCALSLQGVDSYPGRLSLHRNAKGSWLVNDAIKAPFWSVDKALSTMKNAMAPRKTIVLGAFSDTGAGGGTDSRKYRMMTRLGLEVADRVFVVGSKGAYIRKMMTPELEGRLLAIDSIHTAFNLLTEDSLENELILLKSGGRIHLERLVYGQAEGFNCWKDSCEMKIPCQECKKSGLPFPAPTDPPVAPGKNACMD